MKKLFLCLLVSQMVIISCKQDDEIVRITSSEIQIISPENNRKIGVGQMVTASVDVTSNPDGLHYLWRDDYGFSSEKDTLHWFPSKSGVQDIILTLSSENDSKTLTKTVTVYDCDYRLCFWGQSYADVIVNEMAYAAYYNETVNEPILSEMPELLVYVDIENPDLIYSYVLDKNWNVYAGGDVYTIKHDVDDSQVESYNIYIQDYNKKKAELTQRYGNPILDEINYEFDFTDRDEKYLGYNVVFGSCTLKTTYTSPNSTIELSMENGVKYGTASMSVIYKMR